MIDPQNPDFTNAPSSMTRPVWERGSATNEAPVVSIITCFERNQRQYCEIARCLLRQTLCSWEWLVADRTRADAFATIDTESYSDGRIRHFAHLRGMPGATARCRLTRVARCPYVLFLDENDLLEPTAIEKWLWFLECEPSASLVSSASVSIGATQALDPLANSTDVKPDSRPCSTFMIRSSACAALLENRSNSVHAGKVWASCVQTGLKAAVLPEHLLWREASAGQKIGGRVSRWNELWKRTPNAQSSSPPADPFSRLTVLPTRFVCHNQFAKTRKRVLLLLPYLFIGGSEKVALDTVSQLTQRGWEVTVVATDKTNHNWQSEFAKVTPDVFVIQHIFDIANTIHAPRLIHYLINSRQIDAVLISNSVMAYQLLPYLRCHFPSIPVIAIRHAEFWPHYSQEFQSLLDFSIVSMQAIRERLLEKGESAAGIEVNYTNIDTEHWRPNKEARQKVRRRLGIEESVPTIVYSARLVEMKQPDVFAETVHRLRGRGVRFAAIVTGDGPKLNWLRDFVTRHQLSTMVHVLGAVPGEEMPAIMASGDVFFLPSQLEGIAMTAFESMACGMTFVSADVGGQRELVTPECGVLIPRGDRDAEIARYTDVLADLLTDHEKRRRMATCSLHRVRDSFRLELMADRLEALLEQAMRRARSHPWVVGKEMAKAAAASAVNTAILERRVAHYHDVYDRAQNAILSIPVIGGRCARLLHWAKRRVKRVMYS